MPDLEPIKITMRQFDPSLNELSLTSQEDSVLNNQEGQQD